MLSELELANLAPNDHVLVSKFFKKLNGVVKDIESYEHYNSWGAEYDCYIINVKLENGKLIRFDTGSVNPIYTLEEVVNKI